MECPSLVEIAQAAAQLDEKHGQHPTDGTFIRDDKIRIFESGATRDIDQHKPDYEGFFSPTAFIRYGQYMNEHRVQSDGQIRDSDNWQKGIPVDTYMKSLFRHFMDLWLLHRGRQPLDLRDGHKITKQEALCGILFNAFGYLHEILKWNKSDAKE